MKNNFTSECNAMFVKHESMYNMLIFFYHIGALGTGRTSRMENANYYMRLVICAMTEGRPDPPPHPKMSHNIYYV